MNGFFRLKSGPVCAAVIKAGVAGQTIIHAIGGKARAVDNAVADNLAADAAAGGVTHVESQAGAGGDDERALAGEVEAPFAPPARFAGAQDGILRELKVALRIVISAAQHQVVIRAAHRARGRREAAAAEGRLNGRKLHVHVVPKPAGLDAVIVCVLPGETAHSAVGAHRDHALWPSGGIAVDIGVAYADVVEVGQAGSGGHAAVVFGPRRVDEAMPSATWDVRMAFIQGEPRLFARPLGCPGRRTDESARRDLLFPSRQG